MAALSKTPKEKQAEFNEKIREEFEFLKYIERIEDKAPEMVKDARIRWLNAICAGVEFFFKASDEEKGELLDKLVFRNTQMHQEITQSKFLRYVKLKISLMEFLV